MTPHLASALAVGLVLALTSVARAEEPPTLARAEAAYVAVDFESTVSLAHDALVAGGNEPSSTLRLYTLLGIAAAALGDEATARDAFRHVVALDPQGHLDKTLSPKIRSPYLDVRGEVTAHGEIRPLQAYLTRQAQSLLVDLDDPVGIAHAVEVSYRAAHAPELLTAQLTPGEASVGPVPAGAKQVEYALVVRDAHRNELYRRGKPERPEVLSLTPRDYGIEGPPSAVAPSPTGYYVASALLAAAGVGAAGVGAYFTVQREQAAHEWNSSSCEQPGASRADQCASVDERRAQAEHLAVGFYVGGGALLAGSLVTFLLAPSSTPGTSQRARLPCTPGVAPLGAACTLSF